MLNVITFDTWDIVGIAIGLVIMIFFFAIMMGSLMDDFRAKQAKKKDKHSKEHKMMGHGG